MRTLKRSIPTYWLLVATTAGALMVVGCKSGEESQRGAGAGSYGGAPEVGVVTIKAEHVPITTELPGRIAASLVAEVRPQVTGIVLKRLFEEGADVKAGDVLYQIDPAIYEASLASAKAALARTTANLKTLRAQLGRYKDLVAIHAVSQQQYDDTESALKQAEADLAADNAAVDAAQINVDYTKIKAPISGRIGRSSITVGALVTANQGAALATIQQLDPVYADVVETSANLLRMKKNIATGRITRDTAEMPAHLRLENGSSYSHAGVVQFSDVTVDPSTASVVLRTSFPNPDGWLLPGMYVRVTIEEGVNEGAMLVPQRGVTFNPRGEATAFVVDASNNAELRTLEIGRSIGGSWLVHSGLQEGDRVIVEGTQRVRSGGPVVPVPAGASGGAETVEPTEGATP